MELEQHYVDPCLVALYDLENTGRDDVDFYVSLAAELAARTVLDLGCGTGQLTRELAVAGRRVSDGRPSYMPSSTCYTECQVIDHVEPRSAVDRTPYRVESA